MDGGETQEQSIERELSKALSRHVGRRTAPASLRRSVEASWGRPSSAKERPRGLRPAAWRHAGWMVAGAALALVVVLVWRGRAAEDALVAEAVNDHLRILYREHPLEVASGGIHQVKPWFEGRVDFAPVVPFGGDDDFPLQGGAVAYFIDRKAAAFVFKRRLHVISLFVFPSRGLEWPEVALHPIGAARGSLETSRGFHVLSWRRGDLGYALVSDVDPRELDTLALRIEGE